MPSSALQIPRKRGRPAKYASKEEKAKEDVKKKRARRQLQSAARRDIQFHQFYAAQQAQVVPSPSIHQAHLQVLKGLNVLADAATSVRSRPTASEPSRFPVLPPNGVVSSSGDSCSPSTKYSTPAAEELSPSYPTSLLPQEVDSPIHHHETAHARLNSQEPTSPNSPLTDETIQEDDNHFAFDDDDQLFVPSTLVSTHIIRSSRGDGGGEAQQVIERPNSDSVNADIL